ncbi:hypothetical protein [Edaphobacter dinghuensis]|uniref:hypothetical protein n=1 Tax=Edaphobacter dinghuensis TaxID=1560005 RepID=UPI00166CC648|nr:hypothetical protein [Edaphobacter dinghuensis]
MKGKLGIILATMVTGFAVGQTYNRSPSRPFPNFTVQKGQVDQDGFPISGAKLCISRRPGICYQMPSHTAMGNVTYEFGLDPHSERISAIEGNSWIFFSAMFSAGGSGTLTRFAMLRYEEDNGGASITNLLPYTGATDESEHAIWRISSVSKYPILVEADFIWGQGETHFDSPHFYTAETWTFDPKSDRYAKTLSYKTSKKYSGGDSTPIQVLESERRTILQRLQTK